MAPHSRTLAWKIPWTEEPGRLQSMGSLGVGHDWAVSLSCTGEGNGNPLQCSCLENPRDRGAWWAAVYGVTQSDTTEATWQYDWLLTETWALWKFCISFKCYSTPPLMGMERNCVITTRLWVAVSSIILDPLLIPWLGGAVGRCPFLLLWPPLTST